MTEEKISNLLNNIISFIFGGIFFILLYIGIHGSKFKSTTTILTNNTDTIIDNGDIWYSIDDSTNKIEWRHIRNSNDSMAVIHIHQGDSLFTWIGKPCNCY